METTVRIGGKAFRISFAASSEGLRILVDGKPVEASVEAAAAEGRLRVRLAGRLYAFDAEPPSEGASGVLRWAGSPIEYRLGEAEGGAEEAGGSEAVVRAHMPGLLVTVAVKPGDAVKPGTLLAVLEAMKMQNEIRARRAGRVAEVLAAGGSTLESGQAILRIE